MGAGHLKKEAALSARRFRVPLPVDAEPGPLDRLTPREREVLAHVARGATNRAIAQALFITEKTASVHVGSATAKLGVGNRGKAAAVARSSGFRVTRSTAPHTLPLGRAGEDSGEALTTLGARPPRGGILTW